MFCFISGGDGDPTKSSEFGQSTKSAASRIVGRRSPGNDSGID